MRQEICEAGDQMQSLRSPEDAIALKALSSHDRLLEAAIEEFADHGRMGARIDRIALRARVNKQLIYHYFRSKDGLYVAALRRAYLRYRGDTASIVAAAASPDPEAALRRLTHQLFNQRKELLQFHRFVQDANFNGIWASAEFEDVRAAFRQLIGLVADILTRGANEGVFRAGIDAAELYVSLAGVCSIRLNNARSLSHVLGIDIETPAGAARSLERGIDHVIDGLRAHR